MTRRWILIGLAAFAALVLANILFLVFWLPHLTKHSAAAAPAQSNESLPATASSTVAAGPASSTKSAPADATNAIAQASASPGAGHPRIVPSPPPVVAGFVFERQTLSPSGNLRIKYSRDRKAKLRRITLEDVRHPEKSEVLCEYTRSAWPIISPNDEWIALDRRADSDGGDVQLYHRVGGDGVHYELADKEAPNKPQLQDLVWHSYLGATQGDPNAPRKGVTVDATSWDDGSHKVTLSVAYLRSASETDVPEPWSCTYDVTSGQVEPIAPAEGAAKNEITDNAPASAKKDASEQNAIPQNAIPQDANAENTPSATNASNETDTQFPGEKFPASRQESLTVPDVNESSLSDVEYAINEMLARHGYEFRDKKVAKQFSQFSWYQPRAGVPRAQIEGEFTDLEKQNLQVLERCRDAKVAAAHRHHAIRGERVDESAGHRFLRDVLQGVSDGLNQ